MDHAFFYESAYEGEWHLEGDSPYVDGVSLAKVSTTRATLTLLSDETCRVDVKNRRYCLSGVAAMSEVCPCNARDWGNSVGRTRDDMRVACAPWSDCMVISEVHMLDEFFLSFR